MNLPSLLRLRKLVATVTLLGLALGLASATPPTLESLGYRTMRVNGKLALGNRPLLAVLVDAEGSGLEFPADHNRDYYLTNIFGGGTQSVSGFLLENSSGRFSFSRTGQPGVIGPVALPSTERFPVILQKAGNNESLADLLFHSNLVARTMVSGLVDFTQFNTDANSDITGDELHLLFIFNEAGTGGATRYPGRVQPPGFAYALNVGSDSGVSFPTAFDTVTHELVHTLGGFDLYGPNCLSIALTLMSCTSFTPDGRQTFHLDPWHKLKLGWCEPRIRSLRSPGMENLSAAQMMQSDAQIVLYDPDRGANEYFILEYRTRTSPNGPGYDRDVAGDGLVIWHVKQGEPPPGLPGVFTRGAPNLGWGGNSVWGSDATTPRLTWTDGSSTEAWLHVQPFASGAGNITVEWRVADVLEPAPLPAGSGYALEFDGIDDYVTAAPAALSSGYAQYTVEAWIKPDSMDAGGIVAWGSYSYNQVNAFVIAPSGLVNYWWGNDLTAPVPSLVGAWHHVAATYNGSSRRIFLDGAQVASDSPAIPPNFTVADFRIGLANTGQYFNGRLDEVRVWNFARSAAQIVETMRRPLNGNETGLIAYWRLDEGTGTTAFNATRGAADTAMLINGPVWTASTLPDFTPLAPAPNGPGNALSLDGVDDYAAAAAPPLLPAGNAPYTVEAWIKPNSMDAGGIVAWGSYANNRVNAFVIAPSGLVNYWWGNDLTAPVPSLVGAWHHVAATYNGTTRRIFLHGVQIASDVPAPPNFTTADFRIGLANAGQYFDGQIDEVRVWNRARSEAEIRDTMRRQLWGNEFGLIAYWRLDEAAANPLEVVQNLSTSVGGGVTRVASTTLPFAPTVTTQVPVPVEVMEAVQLGGTTIPNNSPTTAWFEWGPTTAYGNVTPPQYLGRGTMLSNWTQSVNGLTPGMRYHYRAVASNSLGSSYGTNRVFGLDLGRLVINVNDSGPGSLRQTILDALPGDRIDFDVTGTLTLASEILIDKDLRIVGPGADRLMCRNDGLGRVFRVLSSRVRLSGLSISGHNQGPDGALSLDGGDVHGGAILQEGGDLTLVACVFTNSFTRGGRGGQGLRGSPSSAATAGGRGGDSYGGAIATFGNGRLTLLNCSFIGCQSIGGAGGDGGADFGSGKKGGRGGNGGGARGGAVYGSTGCTLAVTNCTLTGNRTEGGTGGSGGAGEIDGWGGTGGDAFGSAIAHANFLNCQLVSSTIAGNEGTFGAAGAGFPPGDPGVAQGAVWSSAITPGGFVRNTIIAANQALSPSAALVAAEDVFGAFASGGFNLVGTTNGASGFDNATDQTGQTGARLDPVLLSLNWLGGSLPVMPLDSQSPARDRGHASGTSADQRGSPRPQDDLLLANAPGGDGSDIGAYETESAPGLAIRWHPENSFTNIVILSWPSSATGYILQQTPDMSAPSGGWTDVMDPLPVLVGPDQEVSFPVLGEFRLFRLRKL